jgi:uncharacterized membrane protein
LGEPGTGKDFTAARDRRPLTGHALVAFAFNTVIIALLIAVLFLARS